MAYITGAVQRHPLTGSGSSLVDLALGQLDLRIQLRAEAEDFLANLVPFSVHMNERVVREVQLLVRIMGKERRHDGRTKHQHVDRKQRVDHVPLGRGHLSARWVALRRDVRIAEHADRIQRRSDGKDGKHPDNHVSELPRKRDPEMDPNEHAQQGNRHGQGGRHDVGQKLRLPEQSKHDGIQRKFSDPQKHDQDQVVDVGEWNCQVPAQLLLSGGHQVRHPGDSGFQVLPMLLVGLEQGLVLGDSGRRLLVCLLSLSFSVGYQNLLERCGLIGPHFRDVLFAVLLTLVLDPAFGKSHRCG